MKARSGTLAEQLFERAMPVPFSGCWIWMLSCVQDGYGRLQIGGKKVLAHRAAYEAFVGEIPDAMLVLHRCDIPTCINPAHLFLGTDATNTLDKVSKGRQARGVHHSSWVRGERQHTSKLTADQVQRIRSDTRGACVVAAEYSVTHSNIIAIRRRKTWKHI